MANPNYQQEIIVDERLNDINYMLDQNTQNEEIKEGEVDN